MKPETLANFIAVIVLILCIWLWVMPFFAKGAVKMTATIEENPCNRAIERAKIICNSK